MAKRATGGCLCGEVRFSVELDSSAVGICHCEMCRRWAGAPMFGVHLPGAVRFDRDGTLAWYGSSDWAERGFCSRCGASLFYRLTIGPETVVAAAGTFDDQGVFDRIDTEIYIDRKPDYYAFAGDQERLTGEEFLARVMAEPGFEAPPAANATAKAAGDQED
jgi:hypothetical protein